VLASILVVTVVVATAGFTIWHNHRSMLEEHQRDMTSMGIVLAEQTSRYVQVIDLILKEVQLRIADLNMTTPSDYQRLLGTQEVHDYLAGRLNNVPQANAIVLIDAAGRILNWSRAWPAEHTDVADRDFYQYFKVNDDPGMYFGSISAGRATGKLSLFFVRRVNSPGGRFLGVVLGIIDIKYLSEFYQAAGEHSREAVTLLRRDGTMLMRYPNPAAAIGVKLPAGSPWYARVAEGGGNYASPGTLDGTPSLVSVHPLRDYPLVVDVLIDEADGFAQWRQDAIFIAGFALVTASGFLSLFWMLARQFRRLATQNAGLEEAAIRLSEGKETLRAYAEMSVDWFWEQDAAFRFRQRTNTPFMTASDDTGKTRWDLAGAAMSEERWAPHKADLAARLPFRNFCWERLDSDGSRHFMTISGNPVFERDGAFSGYRGTGREITAEVEAKERSELGRQQFDAVLSNITQGVCFFDSDKRLLLWNRRYVEIYDLPTEAICIGRTLEDILRYRIAAGTEPDQSLSDYLGWQEQLAAANRPSRSVIALKDGRFIAISYQPMAGGGWVATNEDVTDRQRAEARVVFAARHDALTNLANRVLFRERMEQALGMAGRGSHFAVLCLDMDKFKQVNDTMGHPAGDELLVAVADRLQACVREGDTVARLGGDEFAIIQLAVSQPDDAEVLASRILAAFTRPFDLKVGQIAASVSIGVSVAPGDSASYETLMRDADIALYLAKTEGSSTARFFEPEMDTRIQLRRVLEQDIQGAISLIPSFSHGKNRHEHGCV